MGRRTSLATAASLSLSLVSGTPLDFNGLGKRVTARIQHVHIPALEAVGMTAYIERPEAFANATYGQGRTLPLSGVPGVGPSERWSSLLMSDWDTQLMLDAIVGKTDRWKENVHRYHYKEQDKLPPKTTDIQNAHNLVYITSVNIGNQDFELVLDTGSSDTWVVADPFVCRDMTRKVVNLEHCRLNKHYKPGGTYKKSEGLRITTAYADGERLDGEIGTDEVEIGGVKVNTTIGLIHDANWNGDGISSGLIGMAFPSLTRAMTGWSVKRYDPVFFTMWKQNLIAPMFSVALPRHTDGEASKGAMSLGGLPDKNVVNYSDDFARTAMSKMVLKAYGAPAGERATYIAEASSFTINGRTVNVPANFVVDTGTTMSFVPGPVMDAIAAAWVPPLKEVRQGMYVAPCDSKAPTISMTFGGKSVVIDGEDLFMNQGPMGTKPEKGRMCSIGVARSAGLVGDGLSMMGGTFMKSLLVVFDVGAGEMRFSQRIRNGKVAAAEKKKSGRVYWDPKKGKVGVHRTEEGQEE